MATEPLVIWLVSGLVLMLAEIIVPGGIVVFLGLACMLVAGAWQLGFVESWAQAMTLWFISSLTLLLVFRNLTQKLFGGETSFSNTDEDMDIYGKIATVVETIGPGEKIGRIQFQDTTWQAIADGSVIEPGEAVRIICHENISLVVEKTA